MPTTRNVCSNKSILSSKLLSSHRLKWWYLVTIVYNNTNWKSNRWRRWINSKCNSYIVWSKLRSTLCFSSSFFLIMNKYISSRAIILLDHQWQIIIHSVFIIFLTSKIKITGATIIQIKWPPYAKKQLQSISAWYFLCYTNVTTHKSSST